MGRGGSGQAGSVDGSGRSYYWGLFAVDYAMAGKEGAEEKGVAGTRAECVVRTESRMNSSCGMAKMAVLLT